RATLSFPEEAFNRALFRPRADAETYLAAVLSTGNRKELRRQRKRLGELGRLEGVTPQPGGDAAARVARFPALEAAGWEGQEGTALGAHQVERDYFRAIAAAAHARGRLLLLALELDGRPVALKCNFLAGEGSFAFKIAFDENYARFSPGVQLELENVRELHARPGVRWMDSCAVAQHFMINRLWVDRRTIQTVVVAAGGR